MPENHRGAAAGGVRTIHARHSHGHRYGRRDARFRAHRRSQRLVRLPEGRGLRDRGRQNLSRGHRVRHHRGDRLRRRHDSHPPRPVRTGSRPRRRQEEAVRGRDRIQPRKRLVGAHDLQVSGPLSPLRPTGGGSRGPGLGDGVSAVEGAGSPAGAGLSHWNPSPGRGGRGGEWWTPTVRSWPKCERRRVSSCSRWATTTSSVCTRTSCIARASGYIG